MKDVIIISHPRSGSYWYQESIDYFDTNELFNLNSVSIIRVNEEDRRLECSNPNYISFPFLSRDSVISEYNKRLLLFDSITEPKSIKIHHFQLKDNWIYDWIISRENARVVFIERRDKAKAFYSLLISNALKKFKGYHEEKNILIDIDSVRECWKSIFDVSNSIQCIKDKKEFIHVYYEDVLNSLTTFKKTRVTLQNTTERVKIINLKEIENFLLKNNYDISSRKLF